MDELCLTLALQLQLHRELAADGAANLGDPSKRSEPSPEGPHEPILEALNHDSP